MAVSTKITTEPTNQADLNTDEIVKAVVVKKTSTKKASAKKEKTPIEKALEEKAPVEKAPAKEAVKKEVTKKAPAKKKEVSTALFIQFDGKSFSKEDLMKMAKDVWKYDLKQKVGDLTSVELYVKPEENMAYYVMNKDFAGSFYL